MARVDKDVFTTDCDRKAMEQFMGTIKSTVAEIKKFNSEFLEFLDQQRKLAKDLWNLVTRYNILNAGPPCVYPIVQKEELMGELLVRIQDKTAELYKAISQIKEKFDNLPRLHKVLEKESEIVNWDPSKNPAIRGTTKHYPPSEYLEDIADILFQFDVSITCMFQYFDALNLHDTKSYEHLMNAFTLPTELTDFVKEFLIKSITLLV